MNETTNYAVIIFAFLIQGLGEMNGMTFGTHIRRAYDCANNEQNRELVESVERHIVKISYGFNGVLNVSYKS